MEKLIYALWRDPAESPEAWGERLRKGLGRDESLREVVRELKVNVVDAAVDAAAPLRQGKPEAMPHGFVQAWVDTAIAGYRKPLDQAVAAHSTRYAAYLVTESVPLRDRRRQSRAERTDGFAQIALLRRPAKLSHEEWLHVWHDLHTPVARETQSHFEYLQNVVVRRLTPDGPDYDAIVEESFPAAAMTDPKVFFNAAGDEAKFQRNLKRMMDSVHRFIEMERIEVVPTSQYPMF